MSCTSNKISIISDNEFKNGFICSGASHGDGIVGSLESTVSTGVPNWKIAQWACKNDISKGRRSADNNGYSYCTESQCVSVSWDEKKPLLALELLASKEYDFPRVSGQAWPHLLIEQTDLSKRCPMIDSVSSLNLGLTFRIPYFKCMMDRPDDSLHAAQVSLFFTVQSLNDGDFFWFGVPLFDSRHRFMPLYKAEDGGKADASRKYIFTAGQRDFTDTSPHDGQIIEYKKDILPIIKQGLDDAVNSGYLKSNDPGRYTLTTCNLGFEMPGTFESSLEIYSIELYAYAGCKL